MPLRAALRSARTPLALTLPLPLPVTVRLVVPLSVSAPCDTLSVNASAPAPLSTSASEIVPLNVASVSSFVLIETGRVMTGASSTAVIVMVEVTVLLLADASLTVQLTVRDEVDGLSELLR